MRVARIACAALSLGLAIGLSIYLSGLTEPARDVRDVDAYWNAAARLAAGDPLYPPLANSGAETTYRYAPWFAIAWIPMTALGKDTAYLIWTGILLIGAGAAVWPLVRSRRLADLILAALLVPYLAQAVGQGNVQPLLVGALSLSVGKRFGPIAIGTAASLKFFPIAYVVVLGVRREYLRCAAAFGLFAVLTLPMLAHDLSNYPTSPEMTGSLWAISPLAWATGMVLSLVVAIGLARTRYAWLGGSLLVFMASPRVTSYDSTILLVTGPTDPPERGPTS